MTDVLHLDQGRVQALLGGRLPAADRRALAQHLAAPCERCEELLAEADTVDRLDGETDDALLALAEAPAVRDDLAFARVRRAATRRRRAPLVAALGGLAAAAGIALVLLPRPVDHERLKGDATPEPLRLELVARAPDGKLAPLADGALVPAGTTVFFRVELPGSGCVRLWRQDGVAEPLQDQPSCLDAGWHVISDGPQPLGLVLDRDGPVGLAAVPDRPGVTVPLVREKLERGEAPEGGALVRLRVGPTP